MLNEIKGIAIEGISCCVPKNNLNTEEISYFSEEDAAKFKRSTGISKRRIASSDMCASDLCLKAAINLLKELNTEIDEIDILILVTQTPDYAIPNTASLLQAKLGLKKSSLVFDINLGCSGYVYGLGVISSLLKSLNLKKGILLTGDTLSKAAKYEDKSVWPLFGDAASATLVSNTNLDNKLSFDFHTDGARFEAIISPNTGYRKSNSQEEPFLKLDSIGIFNFTVKEVPESMNSLLDKNNLSAHQIDYFILHQANKIINETICKKLKSEKEKFLSSIETYGNTSSSTIPITLSHNLNQIKKEQKTLISGFGVGLSWATALLENMEIKVFPIIEL